MKHTTSFPLASRSEDKTIFPSWSRRFEGRRLRSDWKNVRCKMLSLEFRDSLRVNGLRLRRNVLGDEFLALSKDFAQRTRVQAWT